LIKQIDLKEIIESKNELIKNVEDFEKQFYTELFISDRKINYKNFEKLFEIEQNYKMIFKINLMMNK
jgi:hypothetical protein